MIRLVIADDHPVVRAGLVGLLSDEPGFEVVGEASDGAQAVRVAAATSPDVVLMDLRMPGVDGVEATSRIAAEGTAKVLILTTYESDDQILAAIEAGASGYLLKAAPQDEIVAGIRSVAEGQTALSPQVAVRLVERMRQPAPAPAHVLSAREIDVLRLVARGRSNKHVASLDALRHAVAVEGANGLADALTAATVGVAGGEALTRLCRAYRTYALEHPGRYAAAQRPGPANPGAERTLTVVNAVLSGYGIEGADAVDATRAVRAALHGFTALETTGGFGLPHDVDRSFDALVEGLQLMLRSWGGGG